MPYKVKKSGSHYIVVKKSTGRKAKHSGTFKTRAGAARQMRAMYANEKK